MKNAKIMYAEIILDYFLLEELTKTTTPNDLKRDLDTMKYTYRDIYRYPEKMIDIENDCGAIFTIVYLCMKKLSILIAKVFHIFKILKIF